MSEHYAPMSSARLRRRRRRASMRFVLLGALALLMLAGTTAAATAATPAAGGGLVVVESADDGAAATAPASAVKPSSSTGGAPLAPQVRIPEFVATEEWREILPGQGIPRGLHVRMNLETGKREAKLMDLTDTHVDESLRSVVVDPDATVTVATDVGGAVDTVVTKKTATHVAPVASDATEQPTSDDDAPPAQEPAWNHEKMYEVLQALPEPPALDDGMDLYDAHAKLSTPEFRRQIIKLWKKRQEDLKEALASMQDDSKHLSTLLEQLQDAERAGNTADMVHALEVLEWEVQDLDKTHVFNFIGGFDVLVEYLNATDLAVRAHASWVVGSAAKNYKDGQMWAIDAGALPKLVDALALEAPAHGAANASEHQRDVFEVKKKALYAISSLVLFSERGQRLFLLHNGPELLASIFDDGAHPTSVQLKAALLVHDLLLETDAVTSDAESSLQQLQRIFRSTEWCERLASFFLEHTSSLRQRQSLEILGAMRNQLPACRATFAARGVKSAVETVATAFADDSDLDDDEQRDILAFMADLLGLL